jgi:hypothetical protein
MGKHFTKDEMRSACAAILKELGTGDVQGQVPFLKNAIERAGYGHRCKAITDWVYVGERDPDEHPIHAEFTSSVRKIQATWKANVERMIASTDKETAERARRLSWFLERLDRETYDLSRDNSAGPRKNAGKGGSEKPPHKRPPGELEAALDGDSTPDPGKSLQ